LNAIQRVFRLAEYDDAAGDDSGVGGVKRQRLEALAGSDVASAYPDTSVQFDAAPALDHSSAIAAIAEAYAPVSRDKAIADQEKREAAAAAAKAAQAAAIAKKQRDAAINQVPRLHTEHAVLRDYTHDTLARRGPVCIDDCVAGAVQA
jgi:hypothetical protein